MHFTRIEPTQHYLDEHALDVPWTEVITVILTTKNPRKKGSKYEIENERYYLLFEIKDSVMYIINAKRK